MEYDELWGPALDPEFSQYIPAPGLMEEYYMFCIKQDKKRKKKHKRKMVKNSRRMNRK